ncbi:MAG: response regulator [Clostridia bacterium]|nr:response regulator [Clostridia bacterium]MBQ4397728.1 response regulator [Clostridia bacterium]
MKKILVIDDNKTTLAMAKQAIGDEYTVIAVISGYQALKYLEREIPDLILLDLNMPDMDGKQTMRRMKSNEKWADIPIIVLTVENSPQTEVECLEMGAIDFIAKPFVPQVMKSRIARALELEDYRRRLQLDNEKKRMQLEKMKSQTIMVLANMIDTRDTVTGVHVRRVSAIVETLVKKMRAAGMYPEFLDDRYVLSITLAAPLHDIGKIKIPDTVLKKQGDLTEEEFELMKTHTIEGAKILQAFADEIDDNYYLLLGKDMAAYHHEWWNGKGYPYGLRGTKIPFCARVLAVADVFDALISKRSYKQQMTFDQAFEIIKKGSGGHFDPEIVDMFLRIRPEIERVALIGIDD